ncbi:hypothetical protein [Orbus mooreae]|uniref:hypothetical protein n=1 Tax=Orbus mooreae TaxID=3074107 RepID=UPI00370CFEC9
MKKLLIGLLLIGFNSAATEVTEDMLIGKWKCMGTVFKQARYDEKGNLGKFTSTVSGPWATTFITYEKTADSMTIKYDNLKPIKYVFERYFEEGFQPSGLPNQQGGYDYETSLTEEYIFISQDQFKTTGNIIVRDFVSKQKIMLKYNEMLCDRLG